MYRIDLPRVKTLETALKSVDRVHRYTDLIMDHVTTPTTLLDVPFPIYVLRSIAYAEKDTFVDIPDLVEILKDIAYIACTVVTSAGRNGAVTRNTNNTFTASVMKDVHLMVAELNKRVSAHQDILLQLQDLQQQCWGNHNQLRKRKISLKLQQKKFGRAEKDQVSKNDIIKRWVHAKEKVDHSTSAHNTLKNNFQEMLYKERRLRLAIEELKQELHRLLRTNIELRLQKTLENMATTIDLVDLDHMNSSYQKIKSRTQRIDARDIAETLLRNCSNEYEYPDIEEVIQSTGFLEPLPGGHVICKRSRRHRQVKLGDDKFVTSFMEGFGRVSGFGEDVEVDLDRNTNSDWYLTAVGSKHSTGPEFLRLQQDHTFKQKLTVMNGDIAFGWSRESRFGRKKWGFYDSRLVTRLV